MPRLDKYFSLILNLLLFLFLLQPVFAVIPLETSPSWRSLESRANSINYYSTGAVFGDIDGNGFLDLVISNGNDMSKKPNFVYFNHNGKLDTTAGWVSANSEYSGHCALADVDKDGYPDLAVSNYINSFWGKTVIQLYDNLNGSLSTSPTWSSADSMHSFSCAFGDPNGDAYPDLAVACGESYNGILERNRIYYNHNGVLDTLPGWVSGEVGACYDVDWGDVDNDGKLDLAFVCSGGKVRVYKNYGDSIETFASWTSHAIDERNTLAWGDVDNDGYLDLAVANNIQLGGNGYFEVYLNHNGFLDTIPDWVSSNSGYGSAVSYYDVNNDGYKDLAAGRWWGYSWVYENNGGSLTTDPAWSCTADYGSVVEEMVWGDLDGDGLVKIKNEIHPADGIKKVYYLNHYPVHKLERAIADNDTLSISDFCYNLADGWVSLKTPPVTQVSFEYKYSFKQDLAVSNWDRENYVFFNLNQIYLKGDANHDDRVSVSDAVFLINFLFKGGAEPYYIASGDVNRDCQTSISDMVYLINYLFKGGPAPLTGCAK